MVHASSPSTPEREAQGQEFKDSLGFVIKPYLIKNSTSSNRSHSHLNYHSGSQKAEYTHPGDRTRLAREERKQLTGPHTFPLFLQRYPVSGSFAIPSPEPPQ